MSSTITIIATQVDDQDQFESMYIDERRRISAGWRSFPSRSGRYPDGVLMMATKIDLDVFECDPMTDIDKDERLHSFLIEKGDLPRVVPRLAELVESNADATARALVALVGGTADVARVSAALTSGAWPDGSDAAEEAAAFAYWLLNYSRIAVSGGMGICWEYRGAFPLADQPIADA